jgi:predicted nicotinamide N-methyase
MTPVTSPVATPVSTRTQRARLLWRIRQRFDVVTRTYEIAGRSFEFTQIVDPDTVLDQVVAEEDRREKLSGQRRKSDELRLPYWAELWDSAMGIGQFLISEPSPAHGSTALDLGCGMGLTGMVASALGYRVVMADIEPEALLFAQLNSPRASTRCLDWRTGQLGQRFDLIIGADVLYDRKQWQYLEPFWQTHLNPAGRVLLGEPGRQTGDLFIDWLADRGWILERFEQPVTTRPKPIRLFQLTKVS